MQKFIQLLQVNDSMFPIGGFTQSYGLETYVVRNIVKDDASALEYAASMIQNSTFYNDAAFLNKTWHLAGNKNYWSQPVKLDNLVTALKAPMEIRTASQKLGIRFLKLVNEMYSYSRPAKYQEGIQNQTVFGHYAIAYGLFCRQAGIERTEMLAAFYYNTLNAIVTNCAKAVPISQVSGQKIISKLSPLIEELVSKQDELPEEHIGLCCIGQEISCMQHEKLYTRIYIS